MKSGAGLSKGQVVSYGIYGMILNIMDAANYVDNRAEVAKSQFCNWKLAICTKQYPEIGHFPVPIQKLLAIEHDAVADRIAKGKDVPTGFDGTLRCNCKFYHKYLLPCRHIFHLDTELKVLTTLWEGYDIMLAECGMEVYETTGAIWIEEEGGGASAERTSSMIRVQACVEQLQQQLYSIHEFMDKLDLDETVRSQKIEGWVNHVQTTLGSLTDLRPEDIVNRNRPCEL